MDGALWQMLVAMQYHGRKRTYGDAFPSAEDSILCVEDFVNSMKRVGRLLVDRKACCWRIVDIAVLPEYRQKGLGTWAIQTCQQECSVAGAKLNLQVKRDSRALRLYERLGFLITSEDALSVEMVWNGDGAR